MRRWGLRFLVVGAALAVAGSLQAATTVADPIIGTWKVTRGGEGTLTIAPRGGVLALESKQGVSLGCMLDVDMIVGFIDLPSDTALPAGRYNGNFGVSGQGCYYNVALTLSRGVLTGRVVYSENDLPGGPFTLVKVGPTTYRWSARTKAITGSGTVTVDARGKVTAASGTLAASRWKLAVRAPATLAFAAKGNFSLTLSATVTRGACSDRRGTVVISGGKARVTSICGRTIAGTGTVKLDA